MFFGTLNSPRTGRSFLDSRFHGNDGDVGGFDTARKIGHIRLLMPAKGKAPTAGIFNTTIKTSQDANCLEMPTKLRANSINTILSNPMVRIVVNERNMRSE